MSGNKRGPHPSYSLQPGTTLSNRYELERMLSQDARRICYLAHDTQTSSKVVLHEFFPKRWSRRDATQTTKVARLTSKNDTPFEREMQRFMDETKAYIRAGAHDEVRLALLLPHDLFCENDTVYSVTPWEANTSIGKLIMCSDTTIGTEVLWRVIGPIVDGLAALHDAGLIHGNICPPNLVVHNNVLRLALESAPIEYLAVEQCGRDAAAASGPWTDVYGLCATIYACITGIPPMQALSRIAARKLAPPRALGANLSRRQEAALLKGLHVRPGARQQSMAALKASLFA